MRTAKEIAITLTYILVLLSLHSLHKIADAHFLFSSIFIYLFSVLNDIRLKIYPNRKILTIIGFAISGIVIINLSLENLFKPLSNLLLLVLSIKLLEEKKERDIYQILLIVLLSISVSSIYIIDIQFLVYLLLFSIISIVIIVFTNVSKYSNKLKLERYQIGKYTYISLVLFMLSVAISIPLFLILPRTPQPIFGAVQREGVKTIKTGVSSEVEIGKIGQIQQDKSVIFRVTDIDLKGKTPYWRVQVFDTYKENKWITELKSKTSSKIKSEGTYTIILNPTGDKYLPLLDYPAEIKTIEGTKAGFIQFKGGFFALKEPITSPLKIKASYSNTIDEGINWEEYNKLIELPVNISPYIRELAENFKKGSTNDKEIVEKVKEFFKNFEYTMKLGKYEGDPVEYFLKVSKKGNCEYFASATALILRSAGIPTRVVGGFKGAIKNPNADYYMIRNSMAHVWVEAFVNGKWVRIDTTPPYTPPDVKNISKWELLKDSIIFFWYSNIVNFSLEHQHSIIKSLSNADNIVKNIKKNIKIDTNSVLLILFFISSIFILIKIKHNKYPTVPIYTELKKRLATKFVKSIYNKSPSEIIEYTKNYPFHKDVEYIVNVYLKDRFSKKKVSKMEINEAKKRLKNI